MCRSSARPNLHGGPRELGQGAVATDRAADHPRPRQIRSPGEPIFILQVGLGHTNMTFAIANRYAEEHDVVMVGYRGVDGSVRLDCPEVESALKHGSDLPSEETSWVYADAYRSCEERLTSVGIDLGSYGITQQVDDMEAARSALGYDRIDLLSESAGTRTAIIYSWRYPDAVHRSVMIGVNPPGHFLWDARTTDEQIGRYAALCARTTAAVRAPTTSPPPCGGRTPRSPTAGSSCGLSREMCASPRSSD